MPPFAETSSCSEWVYRSEASAVSSPLAPTPGRWIASTPLRLARRSFVSSFGTWLFRFVRGRFFRMTRTDSARSLHVCRLVLAIPTVKGIGIFPQDFFFGALRDVLAAADCGNHMGKHRVPVAIIGREDDPVIANPLDHVWKHPFFRLGGKKPVAMGNILTGLLLT